MTSSSGEMHNPFPDEPQLQALIELFAASETCWFGSVRPDGRAHLAPIWHVWHAGRVFVVTQSRSVRARNIHANPAVSVALPDPMNPVIIEGEAHFAPEMAGELQPLFMAKFNWDIATDQEYDTIIGVTPHKLLAWGSHGEGRWNLRAGG